MEESKSNYKYSIFAVLLVSIGSFFIYLLLGILGIDEAISFLVSGVFFIIGIICCALLTYNVFSGNSADELANVLSLGKSAESRLAKVAAERANSLSNAKSNGNANSPGYINVVAPQRVTLGARVTVVPNIQNAAGFRKSSPAQEVQQTVESSVKSDSVDLLSKRADRAISNIEEVVAPARPQIRSYADLVEALHQQNYEVWSLIQKSSKRIRSLESLMIDHMYNASNEVINNLMNARRIINALESRQARLKVYADNPDESESVRIRALLDEQLTVPCDSINALISAKEIPALPHHLWESTLDELLSEAEAIFQNAMRKRKLAH